MKRITSCMLGAVAIFMLSGCAADLSSGKKFSEFEAPASGKSLVYLIRDENFMAAKLPYMSVFTSQSDGKDNVVGDFTQRAIVGKDMFVPILMEPGAYHFKTAMKTEVFLKPDTVTCLEVGGKYRGVTIFNVEEIADKVDCKKTLIDKSEGVQLEEAKNRIGLK